jgi:hypothetical protein
MDNYSLEFICKNMLDNANLKYEIENNPLRLFLTFIVFGKVDERYFKVEIELRNIFHLGISREIDIEDEGDSSCMLVLNTQITKKQVTESDERNSFWDVIVFGDGTLEVKCTVLKYRICELNDEDYKKYIYS